MTPTEDIQLQPARDGVIRSSAWLGRVELNMKTYTAITLSGAQRRVRELLRQVRDRDNLLDQWARERRLLAMLAAETPQFHNPLVVWEAKMMRDMILAQRPNDPSSANRP